MPSPQSLWITLQFFFVLSIPLHEAMASFTPYISEFQYSPDLHPSKNPTCSRRWTRGAGAVRGKRGPRSPEEGEPVGQEPSIEIRAVLVRCEKSHEEMTELPLNTGNAYNITAGRSQDILEFHGFDKDEPAHHSEVKNCRRKLIVTIKFNNIGKTRTQEEFVVVDHVLDPVTMQKARLLNPFVFKVRQEQVLQLYGLKFQSVVNGEAKEEVINKKSSNYTGCDDSLTNPTCGQMMFDGKPIPYSQGFCCSCDPDVNVARQPSDHRTEALSPGGNSPKIIPGVNNEKQTLSYGKFGSSKTNSNEERILKETLRNSLPFSKRERSLKSSQVQVGLDDEGDFVVHQEPNEGEDNRETLSQPRSTKELVSRKNVNEIHFHGDYPYGAVGKFFPSNVSPPLRAALTDHNPTRSNVKPCSKAARNDERIKADHVDGRIFKDFKESKGRFFPRQNNKENKYRKSNLTADLIELENEYEALKKSRANDAPVFRNDSECKDFRELANKPEENNLEEGKHESPSSKIRSIHPSHDTGASSKSRTPSASSSGTNIQREKFHSTTVTPKVTASNLSGRSSSSITTIPSNNIESISSLAPTTHPALILRQELVNDKLQRSLISGANNESSSAHQRDNDRSIVGRNFSKSKYSDSVENGDLPKGQYADWVIKYAKMHTNQFIDSQPEEPLEFYNVDREPNGSSLDSSDSLSHLADKVMKEVESVEEEQASSRRDGYDEEALERPVGFAQASNNPEVSASLKKSTKSELGEEPRKEETTVRHKFNESEVKVTTEQTSNRTSSKIEDSKRIRQSNETLNKFSQGNSTMDSKQAKIEDRENEGKVKTDVIVSVRKMIEPAVIVRGSGDMVKGKFLYQEQSATVIADRRSEKQPVTEQDYIFLDKNGREERLRSLKRHGLRKEPLKFSGSNKSVRKRMENNNRTEENNSINEQFNRLDNLVKNGLKTPLRTYRSVAYDDPFHQSNDKNEKKIDQQIEKEFAEITDALNESSDDDKNAKRIAFVGENDFGKGSMLREFAVMLNKIPKNDVLKTESRYGESSSRNEKQGKKRHAQKDSRSKNGPAGKSRAEKFSSIHKNGRASPKSKKSSEVNEEDADDESQTNINEIVKEIIKNDYRPSASWTGKNEHSERHKNVAASKPHGEPNSRYSLKRILHGFHVGKLQKKCHDGTAERMLSEEEKNLLGSPLPEDSTVVTTNEMILPARTHKMNSNTRGSRERFRNTESTVLIEATTLTSENAVATKTTLSSIGSTGSETQRNRAGVSEEAGTTVPNQKSSLTTSASTTHDLVNRTICSKVTESVAVPQTTGAKNSGLTSHPGNTSAPNIGGTTLSYVSEVIQSLEKYAEENRESLNNHRMMERASADFEKGELSTAVMAFFDADSDESDSTSTQNSLVVEAERLKAENSDLEREVADLRNEVVASQTDKDVQVTDDIMPTTYIESLQDLEGDSASSESTSSDGGFDLLSVYETSTMISQKSGTNNPEETRKLPSPRPPEGFAEIMGLNNSGNAKVILVKTYSVSENPKEFLDNYEFPAKVKQVLLKKLNLTSEIRTSPADSQISDSLIQKVNKILINPEEDSDDSETQRVPKKSPDNITKIISNYNIGRRELSAREKSSENETEPINDVDDVSLVLNDLETGPEGFAELSKNQSIRNNESKVTRSFTTVDTLPPDDETTHFSSDNDVNMTNFQTNYDMEQPIFAHRNNNDLKCENDKNEIFKTNVEFFYDYDADQDLNENDESRRSGGSELQTSDRNVGENDSKPAEYRRLKKREANERTGEKSSGDKNHETIRNGRNDCPDRNWKGKIDFLKLKKHQDILKEYLNWNPNVDTTVMRIFSMYPTVGVSSTIEDHKSVQDSSTMSIMLIEEDDKEDEADKKSLKTNDRTKDGRLNDKEILDQLSKTPIEDNLMIISVMGKNKLNSTNVGEEKRCTNKKICASQERNEANDDSESRKNTNPSIRETRSSSSGSSGSSSTSGDSWKGRNGRRLMSAVHLSENKDNGLRNADIVPEEKEETVEKDEAFEKYEEAVPRGTRGDQASSFDYLDSSYKKHKRDKLKSNWDELVDKVIVNNNNNNNNNDDDNASGMKRSSDFKNTEPLLPSGKGKTAMEKLHFFNADKYINILARKINRLSNVDNVPEDMESEKEVARIVNDSRKPSLAALVEDGKNDLAHEDSVADYDGGEIGRESGSRNSLVGPNSLFGKLGSDFEISISGKLHINGESEGQPMSISIEGLSMDNATSSAGGDKISQRINSRQKELRIKQADDIYSDNVDPGDATSNDLLQANIDNGKEAFFGEAPAPDVPYVQQRRGLASKETSRADRIFNNPDSKQTVHNVVVRAHPRYQKSPFHFTSNLNRANESADDLSYSYDDSDEQQNKPDNGTDNLADDEPVFDFSKLELRHRKPNHLRSQDDEMVADSLAEEENQSRTRKRQTRRDSASEESEGISSSGVQLVKLIPVQMMKGDEEEPSMDFNVNRKPVRFVTSELPKPDYQPEISKSPKRTRIFEDRSIELASNKLNDDSDDRRRKSKHRRRKQLHRKNLENAGLASSEKTRESEAMESRKNAICSENGEPCFAAPEVIDILYDGRNATEKSANDSAKMVRLSTDDLPPSGQIGDGIILKGVKILSPQVTEGGVGRNKVNEDSEGQRKTIELKNLMTMMNFVKKLGDILPKSKEEMEEEEEKADRDPETVVQVQSVLLLPEESRGIRVDGDDETKQLMKTTSERVVEIGEGVKHLGGIEECRGGDCYNKYPNIVVLGNPEQFDKNFNPDIQTSRIEDKVKHESSSPQGQEISEPGISGADFRSRAPNSYETVDNALKNFSDRKNEKGFEDAEGMEVALDKVPEKIQHRILEVEEKPSLGRETSAEILPKNPGALVSRKNLSKAKSERSDLSNVKNPNFTSSLRSESDDVKINENLEDGLVKKNHLQKLKVKGFEFKDRDESPEIVVRPIEFDGDRSESEKYKIFEVQDKMADTLDEEGTADFGKKEPSGFSVVAASAASIPRHDREARTPLTYAVGVSETGKQNKESLLENGLRELESKKNKRRTQHLANGRIYEKRKAKRKKKKKKKPRGKKKKKNRKPKEKKWWPFKRNLLAVFQDEESPADYVNQESINPVAKYSSKKAKSNRVRKKRQIKAGGAQIRGGQDCMDRRHPPHVNSAKYQESAHCLRFSDLWYSVYKLENPIMEHTVYLQLFEKHTLPDGTTHWDDLTQGSMVRLGTFVRHERDSAPTIAFTYNGAKIAPEKQANNLDPARDRLLVPSPVAGEKLSQYPEVKGGSGEYLVVQSNVINGQGNECDKAGVGFSTFATQPNRCEHPKGTCLKNQPLAYWRHDVEAREAGKPGCYFLSNFASVPSNPIKYNVSGTGSKEYLGLEYHSPHVSAIDIEVRADYNAIVRVGSSGRITEVYVDSTASDHTVVTIVVSNMGLASSPYQSRISDCPTGLPVSWTKAKGAMQVVAPQHDQRITLDLYGKLYVNDFHCSVEVVNHRGELVAMRRIRVQKMDRCFCLWHCLCACIGSVAGLGCQPMSPEHYHAAGFQGPVPVASLGSSLLINALKDVMIFSGFLVFLLVALGLLKWSIGIFIPVVSRWGLDVILEGRQMEGYFEPELRCRSIVTDVEGRVVHPDTGKKSVRICSRRSEFLLNLIFFLTFPIVVCSNFSRRSLAPGKQNCCQDESQVHLLRRDNARTTTSCPKLICVDTYGDSRNSKLEAEDTKYVINELKRSRDSLQDRMEKRCKPGLRNRK